MLIVYFFYIKYSLHKLFYSNDLWNNDSQDNKVQYFKRSISTPKNVSLSWNRIL